ncbi:MAG: hypothetical protein V4685_02970 [Bacteroidota bacterium]
MKKILTLILFLFVVKFCNAQKYTDNYFFSHYIKRPLQSYLESDTAQVKKMLFQHLYRYHYNAEWSQTDTSISLEITHDSTAWVIYSVFYFDSTGKCYSFSNEQCDSFGIPMVQRVLKDKGYKWHEIDNNKYLSDFSASELLEIKYDGNCVMYRKTKLHLTRKQYRSMKNAKKSNSISKT